MKKIAMLSLVAALISTTWSVGDLPIPTCRDHIATQEELKGIPQDLLKAIAMVESRISPWAVNAQGRARFFRTKLDAANFIRGLINQGVGNIGVGCMQLHYASHRRHFKSVEQMLEPKENIAHAAKLIQSLKSRYGSLDRAVKLYHSASPTYHNPYKNRVYSMWARIQGKSKVDDGMLQSVVAKKQSPLKNKSPLTKIKFGIGTGSKKGEK